MVIKNCYIPSCGNTSKNSDKLFVSLPEEPVLRRRWFDVLHLEYEEYISQNCNEHCCEDHFNLKEDARNFNTFRRHGLQLNLKPDVIPHLFLESPPISSIHPIEQDTESATLMKIELHPMLFLGIPRDSYSLVQLVEDKQIMSYRDALIVLSKIRLDDSFERMAIDFNLDKSIISNIFESNVTKLANCLNDFIYWGPPDKIKLMLPIPFRLRYSKVQSIITCFEIEIEKPKNAEHQILTYSAGRGCNTMKYLVSSSPDGVINYISGGVGGRASDKLMIEEGCDYLSILPENCAVMADRGFRHVDPLFYAKKCDFIRLPMAADDDEELSEEEMLEERRIAAVRIYAQKPIRRLREFAMLQPHAVTHHSLIGLLDSVAVIACAISNLHSPQ